MISGTGPLAQNGPGALTLTGVNTYTGATSIGTGSTLTISGSGSLGAGAYAGAIADSGSFVYSSTAAQTLSGAMTGSGSLTQDGPGKLTLAGVNGYAGATTINGGTLALSGTGSIATSRGVVDNGTFDISASNAPGATITTLSGPRRRSRREHADPVERERDVRRGDRRDRGLTLATPAMGSATETLTGTNSYTGNTTLAANTMLTVTSGGSIGSAGTRTGLINIGTGADLFIGDTLGGMGSIYSGDLTNAGVLTVYAQGLLDATNVDNLTGASINNLGKIKDLLTNGGTVTNDGIYTADVYNTGTITNDAAGAWIGNLTYNTGTLTNYGMWTGSGVNTSGTIDNEKLWTGSITNNGGTLLNNGTVTGDVTANGGIVISSSANSTIKGNVASGRPGRRVRLGNDRRKRQRERLRIVLCRRSDRVGDPALYNIGRGSVLRSESSRPDPECGW